MILLLARLCRKCEAIIPLWVNIGGRLRNLQRRKFCLKCSEFGAHNTSSQLGVEVKKKRPPKCACGEADPKKFYGRKATVCGRCHNRYTTRRGSLVKRKAREHLGGKCKYCGYSQFDVSLDIHHTDPSKKDPAFQSMRGWSWKRIVKELELCELVCKNCHTALHCGLISRGCSSVGFRAAVYETAGHRFESCQPHHL